MYSIEQKHFEICVDVCNSVGIATVDAHRFFRTLDGVAVLALLVNSIAKARGEDPRCYSAKTALVDLLIDHLPHTQTWAWYDTQWESWVLYVELGWIQLSYHVPYTAHSGSWFEVAARRQGSRRWDGQAKQPIAIQIATAFLRDRA